MKRSQLAQIVKEEIQSLVKEDNGFDDDEKKAHKAASKGAGGKEAKGVAAQATAALKSQGKKKALKSFLDHMKDIGVISSDNKVKNPKDYRVHLSHFKTNPEDYI